MSYVTEQIDRAYEQGRESAERCMLSLRENAQMRGEDGLADLVEICNELGTYYRGASRFPDAEESYQAALEALAQVNGTKATLDYAVVLINLATAYRLWGHLARSLEEFDQALAILDLLDEGDSYIRASLLNNMALAYQDQGDHEKAFHLATQGYAIVRRLRPGRSEDTVSLGNLALLALSADDIDQAEKYAKKALGLYEEAGVTTGHYPTIVSAAAAVAFRKKNYSEALDGYQKAATLVKSNFGENLEYASILANMGSVYAALGDVEKAHELAKQSHKIKEALL